MLGGARSGKSLHAEQLAATRQRRVARVTYVATARIGDAEFADDAWRAIPRPAPASTGLAGGSAGRPADAPLALDAIA